MRNTNGNLASARLRDAARFAPAIVLLVLLVVLQACAATAANGNPVYPAIRVVSCADLLRARLRDRASPTWSCDDDDTVRVRGLVPAEDWTADPAGVARRAIAAEVGVPETLVGCYLPAWAAVEFPVSEVEGDRRELTASLLVGPQWLGAPLRHLDGQLYFSPPGITGDVRVCRLEVVAGSETAMPSEREVRAQFDARLPGFVDAMRAQEDSGGDVGFHVVYARPHGERLREALDWDDEGDGPVHRPCWELTTATGAGFGVFFDPRSGMVWENVD